MSFNQALAFVLSYEGGYVDHPEDPGGETNLGISKRAYPHLDIKALTYDQAEKIYFRDYWTATRCGELPNGLALLVFDGAVNHGPGFVIQMLQEALNRQHGIQLKIDGLFGPKTMTAVRRCDSHQLLLNLAAQRMATYIRNPKSLTFAMGWSLRFTACFALALETR